MHIKAFFSAILSSGKSFVCDALSLLAAPFYFTFFAELNPAFNKLGYLSEAAPDFQQLRTEYTNHYKYLLLADGRPK